MQLTTSISLVFGATLMTVYAGASNPESSNTANGERDAAESQPSSSGSRVTPSPRSLAWGDFDADGLKDAAALGPQGSVTLLRNVGDGSLEDVTLEFEIDVTGATVLAWGDYDGDGLEDLYVGTAQGRSLLMKNLGATFVDVAKRVGIDHEAHDLSGEWLDWDANGELDLHVMTSSGILLYHARAGVFLPAHLPGPASPSAWYQPGLSAASEAEVDPAAADSTRGSQPTRRGGLSTTTLGSSTPGGSLTGGTASPSGAGTAPEIGATNCPIGLDNAAAPGNCISASTVPTLGSLYPISSELYVDATTGYIGLGTTSPTDNLHASGTGAVVLHLEADTDNVNELDNARIQFSQDGDGTRGRMGFGGVGPNDFVVMSETPNSEVVLGTNDTERMRIDTSGLVGIGTSSPAAQLHVSQPAGDASFLLEADITNSVADDHPKILLQQDGGNTKSVVGYSAGEDHFKILTQTGASDIILAASSNGAPGDYDIKIDHVTGAVDMRSNLALSSEVGDLSLLIESDTDGNNDGDHAIIHLRQDAGTTSSYVGYSAGEDHLKIVTNGSADSDIILLAGGNGLPGEYDLKIDKGTGLVSVKNSLEIRGGADIVERFESSCGELEPGTVVVIDPEHPGALICSYEAYDTKVAGVVSGAGGVNPGICLGQDGILDGDTPVAMTGRIYVKCSAENGVIRAGDLLTTAGLPGFAMKATDASQSFGAVIGKAMSELDESTGLVLVLVNLQ